MSDPAWDAWIVLSEKIWPWNVEWVLVHDDLFEPYKYQITSDTEWYFDIRGSRLNVSYLSTGYPAGLKAQWIEPLREALAHERGALRSPRLRSFVALHFEPITKDPDLAQENGVIARQLAERIVIFCADKGRWPVLWCRIESSEGVDRLHYWHRHELTSTAGPF